MGPACVEKRTDDSPKNFGILPSTLRETSDLESVVRPASLSYASRLNEVLKDIQFDKLNSLVREDYSYSPLPHFSTGQIEKDLVKLVPAHITKSEEALLRCLLLGQKVSLAQLQQGFGSAGAEVVRDGIEAGLFVEESGGEIRTNNLLLCSHKLIDGNVIYAFADVPPYMPVASLNRQRVYLGADSYCLNAKLQTLSGVDGYGVEYGSGSGIQLITVLKMNPGVNQAVGLEIDARARNISCFNAALNHVRDRFTVVPDADAFHAALGTSQISLGLTNPPFIAAPYQVTVPGSPGLLDMSEAFSRAGWGGEDGLFHTRRFIELIAPKLSPENGQVVVYSQFVGDKDGPTAIVRCAGEFSFSGVKFEKFPKEEYRLQRDLTAAQWSKYLADTLKTEHRFIQAEVLPAVQSAALEMFSRTGVDKIYSGIVTLRMPEAPAPNTDKLQQIERNMNLYSAGIASPCMLVSILGLTTPEDRLPASEFGGSVYTPPVTPQTPDRLKDSITLTRSLNGGFSLEVVHADGDFYYQIKDKNRNCVETGKALEGGQSSARYMDILRCVSVTEPQKILRNWKLGGNRMVSASIINEALGISLPATESPLVELIPITNTFRISSYNTSSRSSGFGFKMQESQSKVLFRGTMASPGYLRLIQSIQKQNPGWGI